MSDSSPATPRSRSTKRRLLTLTSVLLCLSLLILWPRSHWRSDGLRICYCLRPNSYHSLFLYSGRGALLLGFDHSTYSAPLVPPPPHLFYWADEDPESPADPLPYSASSFSFANFGYECTRYPVPPSRPPAGAASFHLPATLGTEAGFMLFVPHWFLILLTSLPPLLYLRKARRSCPGRCPTCGYDLRATPDRCPECGTPAIYPPPLPSPAAVSP